MQYLFSGNWHFLLGGVSMKKTTSTLLSMALVFSSFGALSAHAESLQKEKQFSPQLKANIEQWEKTKSRKMLKQKHQKKFQLL